MGSLLPFLDLNLYPEPMNFTPVDENPKKLVNPRIEPKLEPLDELAQADLQTPPVFPNINLNFYASSSQPQSGGGGNDENVFSEYNRISELFSNAFASKMQGYGDVENVVDPNDNSRAIVPVNADDNENTQLSEVEISSTRRIRRKYQQRSAEMVRVTNQPPDELFSRDSVRKTRMLYDCLRVLYVAEGENNDNNNLVGVRRRKTRGDLKACQLLRERGLWMNRDKRIVGAIPGLLIGDVFFFRMELCVLGIHGQVQAGIDYVPASQSFTKEPIATSVIVSGGYEDDQDGGDEIVYTGHGGQDKHSRQCIDQKLECGNLALERSMHYGIEVRVIRGFKYEGSASGKVYVYDGLYKIVNCWFEVGRSGYGVYKFTLVRFDNQEEMGTAILRLAQNIRIGPLVARPTGYVCLDISRAKENPPVYCFNDIDANRDPVYPDYLVKTIFPPYVYQSVGSGTGCECVGGCVDNCFCAMRNGGQFVYDKNGILLRGKPLVFECGPHCQCPPSCRNRVSQNGLRYRFEVFRSKETSWGVRSLDLIQAGSFICEYTGVVLTQEQAQIFAMNGDNLIYPGRFPERWAEWGDLTQVDPNYERPAYPSIPPLDFAMDVSRMRNVACYLSHSSMPNAFAQPVLYDHNNVCFPHLMVFAMENIPPLREISIDYGVADEKTGKFAICN